MCVLGLVKVGCLMREIKSQRLASIKTGIAQSNISKVMNGKRPHAEGFVFKFESEVISDIHENPELMGLNNE